RAYAYFHPLLFSLSCRRDHRDLHSFPTRRSSDLPERAILAAGAAYLKVPDAADHLLEEKIRAVEGPTLDGWLEELAGGAPAPGGDRKSTRLNSSHLGISYAVFCLKKKKKNIKKHA